jgi:hypothetical protein
MVVDLTLIGLLVSILIGIAQIYLAWQQVRLSRNQGESRITGTGPGSGRPHNSGTVHEGSPVEPDKEVMPIPPARPTVPEATSSGDRQAYPLWRWLDASAWVALTLAMVGIVSSLGWIFYSDEIIVESYATPQKRAELPLGIWGMSLMTLIASVACGVASYNRFKDKKRTGETFTSWYFIAAMVGPIVSIWLIVALRQYVF